MTKDELIAEFKENASRASYHHADDSAAEWHLAIPYQNRCREIFAEADDAFKAELREIAGGYLISLPRREP